MIKKRVLSSLALGFLIILLSQITRSLISFFYFQYELSHLSVEEFKYSLSAFNSHPLGILSLLTGLFVYLFAGYIVGKRTKEKGWLYGGLTGLLWLIFILILATLPLLLPKDLIYPPDYPVDMVNTLSEKRVNNLLAAIPLDLLKVVGLTAFGGWLGSYKSKS